MGAQPQPADQVVNQPVDATSVTTQVVPATQVGVADVVVNPNAPPPAGPLPVQNGTQNTTTTTTTTTTNPDGSTTTATTQTDTAPVQCNAGNHEQRTFGGILQDHMDLWKGSGLLSALNLLKTLTWPTAIPTYSLQSNVFGNLHAGLLGLVRDADRASVHHHRDCGLRRLSHRLCGGTMTAILQMIYCFLLDMIASFKDIWLLGWDSILGPVDALLASVGTGGLDGAGDCRSVRLAARSDRHVASGGHYRGGDGGAVPVAVGAVCAVGFVSGS